MLSALVTAIAILCVAASMFGIPSEMDGQIYFDLAVKELQDRTKEGSLDKMVVSLLESKNVKA